MQHLLSRDAPVRLGGLGALRQLPWLLRWWRACKPQVHTANRTAMQRLAQLSQARLHELTTQLALDYEQASGCLALLRTERELKECAGGLTLLEELGVAHRVTDAAACRAIEPG